MRRIKIYFLLLLSFPVKAQNTTITFTPAMVNKEDLILLSNADGWMFRQGNDTAWANKEIDYSGWQKLKPSKFTEKLADKNGKLEGWLRLKFKLDTSFKSTPLDILAYTWAPTDVYLDGKFICSFGNSGGNGKPYKEYNPSGILLVSLEVEKNKEHLLAIHFVDFRSSLPPYRLKSDGLFKYFMSIALPGFKKSYEKKHMNYLFVRNALLTTNIILGILFWLLAFQNRDERNLLFIALTTTAFTITIYCDQNISPGISYNHFAFLRLAWAVLLSVSLVFSLLLMLRIFKRKISPAFKISLWLIGISGIAQIFLFTPFIVFFQAIVTVFLLAYHIIGSWKTIRGAQRAVQVGLLLTMSFALSLITTTLVAPESNELALLFFTCLCLSFPLSLLVYVALRFREIIKEVQQNAKQVVELSEEKKEQALNQQRILQHEVNRQTAELRSTLANLESTQAQLIQSEKMASLGELTAGIAHEIQNPLNFVNNFSEVNKELLSEMKDEIDKGNLDGVKSIANDVIENHEKINHHGKRADGIVKGMLQHSRISSGQKELTDINALADEYLRLAYHGLRAKDKTFNAKIETNLDPAVGKINIVPQEIGRVILNLINNAFYAVSEKQRQNIDSGIVEGNVYEPTVNVSTKKPTNKIEIAVRDNGIGIPQKLLDKIFQPFFTTKPAGRGTGLGLSMSYDIIRAHGGELKVETEEGKFSEFIIILPS